MRKKAAAVILFALLTSKSTFTNNKTIEKNSDVIEQIIQEFKEKSKTESLIKKLKLKGNYSSKIILKIKELAKKLDVEEEWIYKLFYYESRGNPQAINPVSGAVGLIQFMPSTARNLGTTPEDLHKMSIDQQLEYVEKYILKIKGNRHLNSFLDLYLAVFYPHAINKNQNYILGQHISEEHAKRIAKQNKGIDKAGNDDGLITVKEILNWIS